MDEERCSLPPIEARHPNIDAIWLSSPELPIRLPRVQLSDVAQ
jgi:hypothetical protein